MERNLLAALKYQSLGFSVIPVKPDKRPCLQAWKPYQTEKADGDQVRQWWTRYPNANIGIVTGEISGLTVIDVDSEKGREALDEFLPDTLTTPTATTPNGSHLYFQYTPGISNSVRVITDCDVRNDGGYVVAPPSRNGAGEYSWLDGLKPTDTPPAKMPSMLAEILGARETSELSSEHIYNKEYAHREDNIPPKRQHRQHSDNKRQQTTTIDNIGLKQGSRDESLFHLANCLVKGGMDHASIYYYLTIYAEKCDPPFPKKEIPIKIKSALNRQQNRDRNLTQEIRDLIVTTSGNITTTFVYQVTTIDNRADKKKVLTILGRLEKEGLIEKTGRVAGEYRIVKNDCSTIDWTKAETDSAAIYLPLNLSDQVTLAPGNIVVVAGSPNAGKSAFLMNTAKENLADYNIHYFSSEAGPAEFKSRMGMFKDVTIDMLKGIRFYQRFSDFQDVIRPGPQNINLIDYLEVGDNFYQVGTMLSKVHERLDGALCFVGLQKMPGRDTGRGDSFGLEKPRLYLGMDSGRIKIVKAKSWAGQKNPNGMVCDFKLVDGCRFIQSRGWHMNSEVV